jgi:Raf kinase inhibitor-like YbhB/YbcL family protein
LSICRVAPGQVGGEGHALIACQPGDPARRRDPSQYTCGGADILPRLTWSGRPDGTKSLVLVIEDPDSPSGVFRHWAVFDSLSGTRSRRRLFHNQPAKGLHEVRNDFGKPGYRGPCPPKGHGTLAISRPVVDLKPAASASDVLKTAEAYAIQRAELVGTYQR